jgi:hypothetical protein
MTLRTGKSSRYRYYTCCTIPRQGETGVRVARSQWKNSTIWSRSTSSSACWHLNILSTFCHTYSIAAPKRAERRKSHVTELRRRAAEAGAKLKHLYDAIENGIADLSDPILKDRIGELKAPRD